MTGCNEKENQVPPLETELHRYVTWHKVFLQSEVAKNAQARTNVVFIGFVFLNVSHLGLSMP